MQQGIIFKRIVQGATLISAVGLISGCLVTSPFWGQEFNNHASAIPVQAWTNHTGHPVRLECSQAFHGGLYPSPSGSWSQVTSMNPQLPGVLDPQGTRVYSVGQKLVIPASCWRSENTSAGLRYRTALRLVQNKPRLFGSGYADVTFNVANNNGLECIGRENGKDASWYGYVDNDCILTYSNSNNPIPYVIISAKN